MLEVVSNLSSQNDYKAYCITDKLEKPKTDLVKLV